MSKEPWFLGTQGHWEPFANFRNSRFGLLTRSPRVAIGCVDNDVFIDSEEYGFANLGGLFMTSPAGVAISADEKWCIAVWAGFVIIQLDADFACHWGLGRDGGDEFTRVGSAIPTAWVNEELARRSGIFGFEAAEAVSGHRFAMRTYPDWSEGRILEFIVDADTKEYWLERDWVDAGRHKRDQLSHAFLKLRLAKVEREGPELRLIYGESEDHILTLRNQIRFSGVNEDAARLRGGQVLDLSDKGDAKLAEREIGRLVGMEGHVDVNTANLRVSISVPVERTWDEVSHPFTLPAEIISLDRVSGQSWSMTTPQGTVTDPGKAGWQEDPGPSRPQWEGTR